MYIAPVLEYFLSPLVYKLVKIPADKTTYHSNDHSICAHRACIEISIPELEGKACMKQN
jgi:hypothetical protein